MIAADQQRIAGAEVVLPCAELERTLDFFTEKLGFRLEAIFPADAPAVAVVVGHGLRLRLEREGEGAPGRIRLLCRDPDAVAGGERLLIPPNGTRVDLVAAETPVVVPPLKPEFVLSRMPPDPRDPGPPPLPSPPLIPGRLATP